METAPGERPYDAGLGTGGKFRKRPFRRSQAATPYDRPPAALRNPTAVSSGWLSKVVDPAHRLITAGAHRLFSSVFRKRLSLPLRSTAPEAIQESRDEQQEAVFSDYSGVHKIHINGNNNPHGSSGRGGLSELEQILKQKTFSRSEVDQLTTLLRSRSDEKPVEDEEKISEMIPSKALAFHDRKECIQTPLRENGIENQLTPAPVISATVLDEDVASPSELAKAYMGSRPSKVSPSMLGLYSEAPGVDLTVISNSPFPPKSAIISFVPQASGHTAIPANKFMTPRSRGRSAIYNLARTPYSRVHQTATIKGSGPRSDAYGGKSASTSSQNELELYRLFGSQQGALKRRSSVLDYDMRSVGPIRRIRQKPNLVSQNGLSPPVSAPHPSSSTKILTDNEDRNMPGTSCTPVPSKSKEMASKIFQHLEKLTTPNEKSPTKLSPSMLHGKALRSLENPDSPEVFEYTHDNKSCGPVNSSLHDAQKSTSEKKVLVEANGPTEFLSLCDASAESGANTMVSIKDTMSSVNIGNTSLTNTVAHPPLKKWAFQMSVHEDFLDLDDDIFSNVVASTPSAEAGEKFDSSVSESKISAPEAFKVEKSSLPSTNFALNQNNNLGASDGSVVAERRTGFGLALASSSVTVRPDVEVTQTSFVSDNTDLSKDASHPIFSFGNKVTPLKEPSAASPSFGLGSKSDGMVPQQIFSSSAALSGSSVFEFGSSSDPKSESLSSFATNPAVTTGSVIKVPESAEIHIESSKQSGLRSEVISKTSETAQFSAISNSTPKEGISTLGASSGSSLNNGFHSSSPKPLLSSVPSLFSGNTTSQSSCNSAALSASTTLTTIITSSSLPIFAPVSSLSAAPIFKFGSSAVPSSSALHASGASGLQTSGASGLQTGEAKGQQDASFGNSTSTVLGGTSLVDASAGSSIFGFSAAATSANSLSQGSTPFSASSGSLPAGSEVTTVTQSKPIQFGTSESISLFGPSSSSSFSSSSSHIGSSAPAATLFSSGSGFANGNTVSSSSGTASGLFGSSLQHTKSPIFGSSFNSTSTSTGFSFGAPAASATTSNTSMSFGSATTSVAPTSSVPMSFGSTLTSIAATSAPMLFGSSTSSGAVTNSSPMPFGSTSAASSGSLFSFSVPGSGSSNGASLVSGFSFTSGSPSTSSQPVFGNPNPVFGTGPVSASNGQISMEDSMAEDTVQASTGTITTFSQQPFSPVPSSFVFGGSTAPSGSNPFQFGGHQNLATQQTQSPFQASGSLDFNASGNFSLGTGGGDKSNRRIVKVKGKHRRK